MLPISFPSLSTWKVQQIFGPLIVGVGIRDNLGSAPDTMESPTT